MSIANTQLECTARAYNRAPARASSVRGVLRFAGAPPQARSFTGEDRVLEMPPGFLSLSKAATDGVSSELVSAGRLASLQVRPREGHDLC